VIALALLFASFGLLLARLGACLTSPPSLTALFEHFTWYFGLAWAGIALLALLSIWQTRRQGGRTTLACALAAIAMLAATWEGYRWGAAGGPREDLVAASEADIVVVWANLHHNPANTRRFLKWLQEEEELPHCIALGETDRSAAIDELQAVFPYGLIDVGTGVSILSRLEPVEKQSVLIAQTRPILRLSLPTKNGPVAVLATHAQVPVHWEHNATFQRLSELMPRETAALLVGDFNTTPWSKLYRELVDRCELRDARQGFGARATWRSKRAALARLPIDHAFIKGEVELVSYEIGPDVGSDHLPVRVRLRRRAR